MEQGNFTYILECSDGSFYTGWTNNLERRVKAHNAGKGAKYTKSRKPVKLVYFETFLTKQEAMRREWEIKQCRNKVRAQLCYGVTQPHCRDISCDDVGAAVLHFLHGRIEGVGVASFKHINDFRLVFQFFSQA